MNRQPHLRLCFLLGAALLVTGIAASPLTADDGLDEPIIGGRGGRIMRVTTLDSSGRGSLRDALWSKGPRIIVFEVGGVIDLDGRNLNISEPFVTIAGQTAPAPGITLIKGGLSIKGQQVIVQHLKVRPGESGREKKSGWEVDGIATNGAHHVLIDHCSCTWSTDENLSASGPRFDGDGPEQWRQNTSHHITFSNCLIAEGLSDSTHGKGEHSKGSLLHDNASFLTIRNNLYASNKDRNPLAKGGVRAIIVNNWIFNPGAKGVSHGLSESEWRGHAPEISRLAIVGNVFEHGRDTSSNSPLFRNSNGPVELYLNDNLAHKRNGEPAPLVDGKPIVEIDRPPFWLADLQPLPVSEVKESIAQNVGARPWDRDPIDARIVKTALSGEGRIIDSETEVGGYPHPESTSVPFDPKQWDLETMQRRP